MFFISRAFFLFYFCLGLVPEGGLLPPGVGLEPLRGAGRAELGLAPLRDAGRDAPGLAEPCAPALTPLEPPWVPGRCPARLLGMRLTLSVTFLTTLRGF